MYREEHKTWMQMAITHGYRINYIAKKFIKPALNNLVSLTALPF